MQLVGLKRRVVEEMENESWSHAEDFQDRKTLANELIQGMEVAKQLRSLLNETSSSTETGRDLVAVQRLLSSYKKTLMILDSSGSIGVTTAVVPGSSDEVVKESQAPPPFDASKKRKTMSTRTVNVRVNPENGLLGPPPDDGFSWRKYGQKELLGAKFLRSYFRCTYKHLKGCLAVKQVQRSDTDPDVFEITYHGEHTCKIVQANPSNSESRGYSSAITFSESAEPQEIIECDDHLGTSQETTAAPSLNSSIHFLKQTTTSNRASSSSIIDHHHRRDNKDFRGSFSPSFKSPSNSAAGDCFFGDGHESYRNPDSELSNIETGCTSMMRQTAAVNELIQGMEIAKQLGAISPIETRDLMLEIVSSFEKSLMIILNCSGSIGAQRQDTGVATAVVPGSSRSSYASPGSDDFDGVVKESQAHPFDASKKRRTMPRRTVKVKVNPANGLEGLLDDGFSWRKYGQKVLLGSKFPISYFRCTYKHLKGCLAVKQVQRSDTDPDVFEITYHGEHTCKIVQANPSNSESRGYSSTITFSESAEPRDIIECDDHLDTPQETTDISSFNSYTHFFQQTTSSRASSSSIIDDDDNEDFWDSYSHSFASPSTSTVDDYFFGDGHENYGSPNSELSDIETGCTPMMRQKAEVNELIQGMEVVAKQLDATSPIETRDLMMEILSSFEKALMILNCSGSIGAQQQDAGVATAVVPGSSRSSYASPGNDDLDGVVKESQAQPFDASKKGKTMSTRTVNVRVNPENGLLGPPPDDGFSWRKYGQKELLGAKFLRSYFRCTYRNLKGCLATKQVQRSDTDPDVFEITYHGEHTCKIVQANPSNSESRGYSSTITFSESAEPQEIIECDDHLGTSQETTAAPSFNSSIHFLKQTTTSNRASSSSIIDHHHRRDNKDFRGSFSPNFKSPSTSAAGDCFFGDGHESYRNPDSELSNIETGDGRICVSTGADEDFVNCRKLEAFNLNSVDLLLLLIPSRSIALNLRGECLVEVYLPGSNDALVQDLVNLKQLDLSCSSFTRMPDLSRACKLQSLDLHSCNNLVDVSSIQYLTKLEHINLKGCTSLACLPSLMALKLFLSLDVSDCINLRRLPPSLGCLSSLIALDLRNCKRIQNLPKGILRLKSVQTLSISGCSMLMDQASGPEGMLIERQVNPIVPSSSRASDEEVSTSYQPVDKCVSKIPLQQLEEEGISSKCNSMASKDAAEPSSTTQDLERNIEVLKGYMNMPVEAIHQANAFYDLQRTIDSLTQRSSDLHESASLQDLMYFLEVLQENFPETMARMHDARVSRGFFQVKLAHLGSSFVQAEENCSELADRLLVISDQEEDLDAEIERLLAKRQELLDFRD